MKNIANRNTGNENIVTKYKHLMDGLNNTKTVE